MKISCAIAIIALVLQGLLLHTDARLGSLDLDGEDYPASPSYFREDSEFNVEGNFNEEASDFVLESSVDTADAESGVYLQTEVVSNHGKNVCCHSLLLVVRTFIACPVQEDDTQSVLKITNAILKGSKHYWQGMEPLCAATAIANET